MNKIVAILVLFSLAGLISAQDVLVAFNYKNCEESNCLICGSPDFASSDKALCFDKEHEYFYTNEDAPSTWQNANKYFMDTVPEGNIVTGITVHITGLFCNAQANALINGESIGVVSSENNCECNSNVCPKPTVVTKTFESNSGFQSYKYQSSNSFEIAVSKGSVKISKVIIKIAHSKAIQSRLAYCPSKVSVSHYHSDAGCVYKKAEETCVEVRALFNSIVGSKAVVDVTECTNVNRTVCKKVTKNIQAKISSANVLCFKSSYTCAGIDAKNHPCVRFYDVRVSAPSCPTVTQTLMVPNSNETVIPSHCIPPPVYIPFTTGAVTSGAITSAQITSGGLTTSKLTSGASVSTSALTSVGITSSFMTTGFYAGETGEPSGALKKVIPFNTPQTGSADSQGILRSVARTIQSVYTKSELGATTKEIHGIRVRLSNRDSNPASFPASALNFDHFDVFLSVTPNGYSTMSTTMTNNEDAARTTQVRAGKLTVPAGTFSKAGGVAGTSYPNFPTSFMIAFSSPFAIGDNENLVIRVSHSGQTGTTSDAYFVQESNGGVSSTMTATSYGGSVGTASENRFSIQLVYLDGDK